MANVIRIHETGGPEVLRVEAEQVGEPGRGEVRLRQEAVGINAVDALVRQGLYPMPLPAIPGFEAAGVIDAVGEGVSDFAPGDRVAYFFAEGGYATEKLTSTAPLVRLPDDISTEMAGAFLAKGLTAWMGLRALYAVKAGDRVFVLGASGSVGSILSRWAKALGAEVVGVAGSASKLDKVRAGATHALLATDPDAAKKIRDIAPDGVDVVYDFVGAATFGLAVAAIRDGGTIAAIGQASGQPSGAAALAQRGVEIRGGGTPQYVNGQTVTTATDALWDVVRSGIFADLPIVRYAFGDIARAHADLAARRLEGIPVAIV
jgi:NADPH:quinone reductase